MDGWRVRSAAIGCAFASCAMVVGPGFIGTACAHAGIFGFDFFGDDDKSDIHHPRPGSEVSAQSARIAAAEPPSAKIGSVPETATAAEPAAMRSLASVPQVEVARAVGGGGAARVVATGRSANLPRVSTAPSARTVVIRRPTSTTGPASVLPVLPRSPDVVALAAPSDEQLEPESRPAPVGPRSPATPRGTDPLAPGETGAEPVPESFRVGYAEYLRSADTGDLFIAALPGIAGIAGFTVVGAYAGYRQARALQQALLAPVPTRILL